MVRAARRTERAQSLVEFAFTIGTFLVVLFGALAIGLYAVQRSAAVTAAAAGVRAAASAQPTSPNNADLSAAAPLVTARMQPVLFGSTLDALAPGTPCDALAAIPPGTLEVCSSLDPSNQDLVLVEIRGKPKQLLPLPIQLTIDAPAEIHRVTFTR